MTSAASQTTTSRFWHVTRQWDGESCYIIGGGPSLANFDFNILKGRRVLGCNHAFRLGPEIISFGVFGDASFFCRNARELEESPVPLVTCSPSVLSMKTGPHIHKLKRQTWGIHNGESIGFNHSTGAMAINLAINLGASPIYLLGYDMGNQGNKSHWHDRDPRMIGEYSFDRFSQGFQKVHSFLPSNVEVLNVTDGESKLPLFPRITFAEFYRRLQ